MSVYVDDYQNRKSMGRNGTWVMSHMIADTRSELDEMAEKIELDQKWKQLVGTRKEHFDVTESYRRRAIKEGAVLLTVRELVDRIRKRDLKAYLEG